MAAVVVINTKIINKSLMDLLCFYLPKKYDKAKTNRVIESRF